MSKIFKYLTILPIILLLSGCGGSSESITPEGDIKTDIVGQTITKGNYQFKFNKIINTYTKNGDPAIFFAIDFTNNSDEEVSPNLIFSQEFEAFQYDEKEPKVLLQELPKDIPGIDAIIIERSSYGRVQPHSTNEIIEGYRIDKKEQVMYLRNYPEELNDKPKFIYEIPAIDI